ncbi:uncharacterized protein EAE97_002951 [Botrytis byssoidea]|uniref:Carboxylesterase type B domain-containing protein n=1 Tax=Botrytis byssoidea TaxID=139641 RepID=A0A9P5LWY5_9HELO|nr:uncharacterized protein EAE97_002951 [Botrytis byssoidea]KAF7949442.1 hypothetical protein EAE97_002951 [Botrytis byssoidea]
MISSIYLSTHIIYKVSRFPLGSLSDQPFSSAFASLSLRSTVVYIRRCFFLGSECSECRFVGVPYAQSTFGKNRFRKAQPLPASAAQQIIHANAFGPNCPQYEATPASVYTDVRREYFIQGINGDDCLSVSVWAPLYPTEEKVPVIVWIYGGGQTTGGSSVPYQNPQQWVQRTQSHIVVSLQYRLNFFGQPNTPTENTVLYIFDARAALE